MEGQVAILGAGIGGLAAALACGKAGIPFQLFDSAPDPLSGGAALTLWPNALCALRDLGLFDANKLPDWMHPIQAGDLRTMEDRVLYKLPLNWMNENYTFGPVCVERHQLLMSMYERLERPEIRKLRASRVLTDAAQRKVFFSNDEDETSQNRPYPSNDKVNDGDSNFFTESFDAVIAADGIHSPVRRQFFGDTRRGTKYTAWRGIATGASVPIHSMSEYLGSGVRFGYATISSEQTYWFATMNNRLLKYDSSSPNDGHILGRPGNTIDVRSDKAGHSWKAETSESWPIVTRALSSFPAAVKSCLERTPVESILQNRVQDVRPLTSMAVGNVALLGDAAHAVTPNLGFGACLALEDASVLLQELLTIDPLLRPGDDLTRAFSRYAQRRRTRVAMMAQFTRFLGDTMQYESSILNVARDSVMARLPVFLTKSVWKLLLSTNPRTHRPSE